jgi:hypothetical protein
VPHRQGTIVPQSSTNAGKRKGKGELVAVGLFRGPVHIIEYLNEALRLEVGRDICTGMPASEAWPQRIYRPYRLVMDAVYQERRTICSWAPAGTFWVIPRYENGDFVGVATAFLADAVPRPLPRRPLRSLLAGVPMALMTSLELAQ